MPTDPSQGESDDVIFTINEEFTGPDKVAAHIETAKGNDYFPEFGEILGKYGIEGGVVQALGNVWFKLDSARCEGARPATGATINILYIVPKDKADEVQATITKHTEWMKGHYGGSTDALISAYFTKAPQVQRPDRPVQGRERRRHLHDQRGVHRPRQGRRAHREREGERLLPGVRQDPRGLRQGVGTAREHLVLDPLSGTRVTERAEAATKAELSGLEESVCGRRQRAALPR